MSMLIPKCEQYLYTQIFEMTETDAYKQEAFLHDFRRYNEWKLSQVRYDTEFGITHQAAKDQ